MDPFEIASSIEATNILNAYRKVQSLKTVPLKVPPQPKIESTYFAKVKETIKEINATKSKETKKSMQVVKEIKQSDPFSQVKKAGAKKVMKWFLLKRKEQLQESYARLRRVVEEQEVKMEDWIKWHRIKRVFASWKDEVVLSKLQAMRRKQLKDHEEKRKNTLAQEYQHFNSLRGSFKRWNTFRIRERKRREESRREEEQREEERSKGSNNKGELQHKLKDFLDGLKNKIQKDVQIKREIIPQEDLQESKIEEHCPIQQLKEEVGKAQSNDDLEIKRRQLQDKYKQRKLTLQTIRRQKEQRKAQSQQQKAEKEREIQLQKRKLKQQQYRLYVQNKQNEAEWEKKQLQLQAKAQKANKCRLMMFHGWRQLKQERKRKQLLAEKIAQGVRMLACRIGCMWEKVMAEGDRQMERLLQKSRNVYRRALMKSIMGGLKVNRKMQREENKEMEARAELVLMRKGIKAWKGLLGQLRIENIQWERPRNKRAEAFRKFNLIALAFKSLHLHKESERKERNINMHKNKIKQKIYLLQQQQEIDYSKFL